MAGRARGGRDGHPSIDDLLAGRGTVGPGQLFALIHDVNPTAHDLPPNEARRRYRTKAALQSLLIRRHGEYLRVDRSDDDEAVVSLRHALLDQDACHAVVAELDEDARSWVRRQLDTGNEASAAVRASAAPISPATRGAARGDAQGAAALVVRGRQALAEYDIEAARACFAEALERSPASAEAAVELIAVLVDWLAAYGEALEVSERLPQATVDGETRARIATAAVHSGRLDLAAHWLRGVEPSQSSPVLVLLGDATLRTGDWGAAERWCDKLRAADPAHPSLPRLTNAITAARAAQRAPDEARLQEALDGGRLDEAAALARGLLERWPESAAARRAVRAIEAVRRDSQVEALLDAAAAAAARGDLDRQVALLKQAAALAPEDREIGARARDAEARRDAERERDLAARVRELLARPGGLAEGLLVYGRLDAAARAHVRALVDRPELTWVEPLLVAGKGRRVEAAVEAAVALAEAAEAERAGDPERVLALLEPFERAVTVVPEAPGILMRAREELASRRRDEARAALEAAELERTLAERRELERLIERAELLASGPDPLAARDAIDALLPHVQGFERDDWVGRRAALDEAVRRELRVVTHDCFDLGIELVDMDSHELLERTGALIAPNQPFAVLVRTFGAWIFIRVVDVRDGRTIRLTSMRAWEDVGEHAWHVDDRRLTVVSLTGQVLVIGWRNGDLLRKHELAELKSSPDIADDVMLVGSRFAWFDMRRRANERSEMWVFDLQTGRLVGRPDGGVSRQVVQTRRGPVVATGDFSGDLRLWAARGTLMATPSQPEDRVCRVVCGGGDDTLLALQAGDEEEVMEEDRMEVLRVSPVGRRLGVATLLPRGIWGDPLEARTARATGITYLTLQTGEPDLRLLAFRFSESGAALLFDTVVPAFSALLTSETESEVVLCRPSDSGLVFSELSDTAPDPVNHRWIDRRRPAVTPPFFCRPAPKGVAGADLLDTDESAARALAALPTGIELRSIAAERELAAGRITAALRWLEGAPPPESLDRVVAAHHYHLLAAAHLAAGNPAAVADACRKGLELGNEDCEMEDLLEIAQVAASEDSPPDPDSLRCAGAYVLALTFLTRKLAAEKRYHDIVRMLHTPRAWRCQNADLIARRAQAYLGLSQEPPADPAFHFNMRMALACCASAEDSRTLPLDDAPRVPSLASLAEFTREVAKVARIWLDAIPVLSSEPAPESPEG